MEIVFAITAALILAFALVAKRLGRWNLTAPIVFVAVGYALSFTTANNGIAPAALHDLAEVTLVLVLFADAASVKPNQLGPEKSYISRLLFIALPLTVLLGMAVASMLFPELPAMFALLLAAIVAPTDAALGAATVMNKAVPVRIRRILNVESGLNDGLVTPVVLFALAAISGTEGLSPHAPVGGAFVEIGLGAATGIAVGFGGGWLVRWSHQAKWSTKATRMVATLALPALAYAVAQVVSGNGFIAAFVAGTSFAAGVGAENRERLLELTEGVAEPLGYATWLAFGALGVPILTQLVGWREITFAVLALTVLRMLPTAIALLGTGFKLPTVAFIGWFGPRGLASVVFGVLAVESLERNSLLGIVVSCVTLTVLLSVVLHGVTAGPWARKYGEWANRTQPQVEMAASMAPVGRSVTEGTLMGGDLAGSERTS